MKTLALTIAANLFAATTLAGTFPFDDAKIGELPAGWFAGVTGQGQPKWSVETDTGAPSKPNVLKQSGEGAYPWCVKADTKLADGFVEVKFKPLAGKEDQAGGVVWRWKDRDNYYVARANALEDNVRIYHFVNGKRTQFKGANLQVTANEWHTLRVDFRATRFTVSFDGKPLFEADDDKITGPGAVGVWTKADSVTVFDDFSCGAN
ncbi:MAG: hypothetical protein HYY24_02660 [Verrucomicrobia bacterium]|nr:hypothetical protein [Verrucomicrobiota bacterium]